MAKNTNRIDKQRLIIIILISLIVICVVSRFILLIIYKDTPVSELPTWVYWLLHD